MLSAREESMGLLQRGILLHKPSEPSRVAEHMQSVPSRVAEHTQAVLSVPGICWGFQRLSFMFLAKSFLRKAGSQGESREFLVILIA